MDARSQLLATADVQQKELHSNTEMSESSDRPCMRLTASQGALIRFLSKRKVSRREITAHPECGWVASTIDRHNRRNGEGDAEFITSEFHRIFAEARDSEFRFDVSALITFGRQIKDLRRKNRLNRGPNPVVLAALPEKRILTGVSISTMPSTASASLVFKEDFLDRFVQSASMDPSCAGALRARVGFSTTEKLCENAKKMHIIANRYSKEQVETYFSGQLPAMTLTDIGRLIKALLRLGKSLY
ncbi:hypothetical protein DFH06DRAFT_1332528 [Mycena polygramma]|nr:hypothetical protein DFH06DRAFT_1332528 [Mycena polygramma]